MSALTPLIYRQGLRLAGTLLWFDADRARELSFVSHARVRRASHHRKRIVSPGTEQALTLLGDVGGRRKGGQALVSPFGQQFSLGELSLQLLPVGAMWGASALYVRYKRERLLYSSLLNDQQLSGAEIPRWRRARTFVLADPRLARGGSPRVSSRRRADLWRFVEASLAQRACPVLLCDPLASGPRLFEEMSDRGYPVAAETGLARLIDAGQKAGLMSGEGRPIARASSRLLAGGQHVVLWSTSRPTKRLGNLPMAGVSLLGVERFASANPEMPRFLLGPKPTLSRQLAAVLEIVEPKRVVFVGELAGRYARQLEEVAEVVEIGPREQLELFKQRRG